MKLTPLVAMAIFCASLAAPIPAQMSSSSDPGATPAPKATQATVPPVIRYSSKLIDADGRPMTGTIGVTFSLYAQQSEGAALWMETQAVKPDPDGNYNALLGSESSGGIPLELFSSGEARWLGIQVAQKPEQARILLVSVPYALKAVDSETLGGLPPSAFLMANSVLASSGNSGQSGTADTSVNVNSGPASSFSVTTSGGTLNFVPLWLSASTLGNSVLFQSASKSIGIGNSAPAATLDVTGGGIFRGTLELPAVGTATATTQFNSQPFDFIASVFSSSAKAAEAQHFRWQVEPVGNNTATPSGKLNLLYASGSGSPAETGISISNKGVFTFATGQTFPGTGTLTGITTAAGSGLTGGVASGVANISLLKTCAAGQTLTWSGAAWACTTINGGIGTITDVVAGTGLTGGGTKGSVTLSLAAKACAAGQALTALPFTCTKFATTGPNTFTGNQTISGDLSVTGNLGGSDAAFTGEVMANTISASGNITATGTLTASMGKFNGVAITGNLVNMGNITATGANSVISGVTGMFAAGNTTQVLDVVQGGSGSGILATTTTGEAVIGKSTSGGFGLVGDSTGANGVGVFGTSSGAGSTGVNGLSTGGRGVQGNSDVRGGVAGISTSSVGVGGVSCASCTGAAAIYGTGHDAGLFNGNVGVNGTFAVTGVKAFHIDHPLDPGNKYLNHFAIESNEVLNTYSGNVTTDGSGLAEVKLPDYFEALNTNYRYQLTVLGQFAQAIIWQEIANNQFVIKTDKPSVRVSWQVTGVRSDANVKAHPMPVEEDKPAQERGYYLTPEVFGQPAEQSLEWLYRSDFVRDAKLVEEKRKAQAAAAQPK